MRLERSLNWHLAWPDEKGPFATGMIERINKALQKPIQDLDPSDLRLLIRQKMALEYVVPLAITAIRTNPMQSATYFDGDLLEACLEIDPLFWAQNPDQHARLKGFFQAVRLFDHQLNEKVGKLLSLEFDLQGKKPAKKTKKGKAK